MTQDEVITPRIDDYDPEDHYPPKGTPESCLLVSAGDENYFILAHTGRYFHGTVECAGMHGEEAGIDGVPEYGWWVFENGSVVTGRCPETGYIDSWKIYGDFRPPTLEDFKRFDVDPPAELAALAEENARLRRAVSFAKTVFLMYGDLHAAKPDPEKAKRNYELADMMENSLYSIKEK